MPAVVALLLATAASALAFDAAQAQNRVANPGFEYGTSPWVGNWTTAGGAHSGIACGSATIPAYAGVGQSLFGKLEPGQTYTLSAWLRTTTAPGPKVRLVLYQVGSGGSGSTVLGETNPLTTTWALYSTNFTLSVTGTLTDVGIRFTNDVLPPPPTTLNLLMDDVSVTGSSTMDVPEPGQVALTLDGALPNPSRGDRLELWFTLPTSEPARIELLDVSGRRVAAREVGWFGAGRHTVDLAAGRPVAPGLYFARLSQGGISRTVRVAVVE